MSVIVSPSEEGERERGAHRPVLSCHAPTPGLVLDPGWGMRRPLAEGEGGVISEARVEVARAGVADRPSLLALLSSLWETV